MKGTDKLINLSINISTYLAIILIIFLINIKHKLLYSQNFFGIFIMGFLTTLPHEAAHYITAFILGAKPQGLSIVPKKVEYSGYVYWSFGNVRAYANKFTGFFVGIAPVIWLIVGFFIAKYYFYYFRTNTVSILGFFFIEWIMIENGIPSREDLKIAFRSFWGVLFFFMIIMIFIFRSYYEK